MNYSDIITIEPGKRGGKPCIRGLRITVYDVLEYLASGMTNTEIFKNFHTSRKTVSVRVSPMQLIGNASQKFPTRETSFRREPVS
ncbi:MAG TPA: DUF433 domain-containing protein [Terriglobales bacterium]|nr:DUF433 domain-containing protein [Terriglobales bacterium]